MGQLIPGKSARTELLERRQLWQKQLLQELAEQSGFKPGSRVQLLATAGLVPAFGGSSDDESKGTLVQFDHKKGRWGVRMDSGQLLWVTARHLRLLVAAERL